MLNTNAYHEQGLSLKCNGPPANAKNSATLRHQTHLVVINFLFTLLR